MRWLLLDEVVSIEPGVKAQTQSHIPNEDVSPEFLMMEMMAQTGGLLLGAECDFKEDVIFAKIAEANFQSHYQKDERIHIEVSSENLRAEGAWMDGVITNQSGKVAESRFLLMNVGHLLPDRKTSITFHDAFMNHFCVRDKIKSAASSRS